MMPHDLMRDVLKRTSAKLIAAEMGLSLSLIYQWATEQSAVNSPLVRIAQLLRATNDDRIGHWLAAQLGGLFVPRTKPIVHTRTRADSFISARMAHTVSRVTTVRPLARGQTVMNAFNSARVLPATF